MPIITSSCLSFKGVSLDKLWPALTSPLKRSAQAQLHEIIRQLRSLPLPSGPAIGSGEPRRGKDTRHLSRISAEEIRTEKAFNDFLTTDTEQRKLSPFWMEMLRSRLRSDHKMVMAHGDLRDANIMAEQKTPDSIYRLQDLSIGVLAGCIRNTGSM